MILKYLGFILFTLWLVTASDPHFGTEISWEKKLPKENSDDVTELSWMSVDSFKPYLLDEDNRVSDEFPVSPYFYPTVNFWFMIYTQFTSNHVVIHDKTNLKLIYKVLDFSSLHAKKLSRNILYVLQQKITSERIQEIKSHLKFLTYNPFSLGPEAKSIYRMLKEAEVPIPTLKNKRIQFFKTLAENIRAQTGQKNFIKEGIVRSLPFKPFLKKYFTAHNLPTELLAIPFLESSFNPKAESKVGALGAWQFMPLISSYYVPKKSLNPEFDYRSNVGVISVAAAFLMKENYQIMKSWDLAVTAYNSGTKHLLKTKKILNPKKIKINLEQVIRHSDSQHFGFASKNFYSEFLALVHALAYEEELFDEIHKNDRHNVEDMLTFHLTKCQLKLDKSLSDDQLDDVLFHNHHINQNKLAYQKATIIAAKIELPKNKFLKLNMDHLVKKMPKEWNKYLGNQSCSTK